MINIPSQIETCNLDAAAFLDFLGKLADTRHKKTGKYYKLNNRAIDSLSIPNLHFYLRTVKIANFQTGGNVSKQFQYFGGRWNRAAIYKNLAKLRRLGFIRQDGRRSFRPVPGGKRTYINAAALEHIRSRQDTIYFKMALFLVNYRGDFGELTQRAIKAAGFASNTAEFLHRWIGEHLNKTRLNKLYNAIMWTFRQVGKAGRKVLYWISGTTTAYKFRKLVPNWRKSRATFNIVQKQVSNAPPWNGGSIGKQCGTGGHAAGLPANSAARRFGEDFPMRSDAWPRNDAANLAAVFAGIEKLQKSRRNGGDIRSANAEASRRTAPEPEIATAEDFAAMFANMPHHLRPRRRR